MIEQLHYTWSDRGLQGRARYQVTAVSPGLADLSGAQVQLALRLCRWSGGENRDAKSFGWIDARGSRFAFRRVAAGRTGDGRPGRFAAHVLVAPISEIEIPDLLHRPCAAGLWWGGEPEQDATLPRLAPQPLSPWGHPGLERGDCGDEILLVLAELLATGGDGQVSGPWQAVLGAAALLSRQIPRSFDSVASFSTFEDGESADWFQLVGTGGKAGGKKPSMAARAAAALIASSDENDLRRARAAADATVHGGQVRWDALTALSAAFRALVNEATVDCTELLPSLRKPGTADEVLRIRRGRGVVADALLAGRTDVLTALAPIALAVKSDLMRQLGIDIADRKLAAESVADGTTRGPGPATWQALLRVTTPLGRHALDGVAEVALRLPVADSTGWPREIVRACLRSTALKPDLMPTLAKAAADPDSLLPALTDAEIPVEHRAEVAVAALSAGTLSPAEFIDQTAVLPELLHPAVIRLLRDGQADGVLLTLPLVGAACVVSEIAPELDDGRLLAACRLLWPRLALPDALNLASTLSRRAWQAGVGEWNAAADGIVRQMVRAELDDRTRELDPVRLQRACSSSERGQAWRRLAGELGKAERRADPFVDTVAEALRAPGIATDLDARAYAIQVILAGVDPEMIEGILRRLLGRVENWDLQAAIVAADRRATLSNGTSKGLARLVIIFIAVLCVEDPSVVHAARQLARNWINKTQWKVMEDRLSKHPSAVRKCLGSMEPKFVDAIPVVRGLRR